MIVWVIVSPADLLDIDTRCGIVVGMTEILTKTLRDGSTCTISIIPDGAISEQNTTLGWWLEIARDGQEIARVKAAPHLLAKPAVPGITHGLYVKHGTSIGLTSGEAERITTAVDQWVAGRKAAAEAARNELAARVRAVAPGAPTRTISSPFGVPGVGSTERLDDGSIVTSLRVWHRYYREDGLTFGAADDAGYVYYAEVRDATDEEAAPVLAQEQGKRNRQELRARIEAEIVAPATRPDDDEIPDLFALPEVQFGGPFFLVHLRVDHASGTVWVLRYNGADGDNWSYNNYRGHIATSVPLTDDRAALLAELAPEAAR